MLTTTQLAAELGVSKGRISQYVSEGKLEGCFQGSGRARRFDLGKVAAALGRSLHPGQMLGNGAQTKEALNDIEPSGTAADPKQRKDGPISPKDPDRYELARIQKAEEEARRLRRQNAEAEGLYVLASEVESVVAKQIGQEIAEFEKVLREGARTIADTLGVDFKSARKILLDGFREHRKQRTEVISASADAAQLSAEETDADI